MAGNKPLFDGECIRLRRAALGWSQGDLAEATRRVDPKQMGLAVRTIWDAENRRPVTRRTQLLIARALQIEPEALQRPAKPTVVSASTREPIKRSSSAPIGSRQGPSGITGLNPVLAAAVTLVVVAGISTALWLRYQPAATSPVSDGQRPIAQLDDAIWTINGSPARAALANLCIPRATIVQPTLSFSRTLGLGLTGINGTYEQAGVQSVKAFRPPFTVAATVMATTITAGVFQLLITNNDGGRGVVVDGAQGGNGVFTGLFYRSPDGPGRHWELRGRLSGPRAPALSVWYRLIVSVDASGKATVGAGPEGAELRRGSLPVGTGPFYVVLSQGSGAHGPGPNQAYWRTITISRGNAVAALPTWQLGRHGLQNVTAFAN